MYIRHYGAMHLEKLPANAILIVKGDVITNSIRYLQRCEGMRPDVQHLDQSMMTYKWFVRKQVYVCVCVCIDISLYLSIYRARTCSTWTSR